MGQNDEETFESHLHKFGIVCAQTVNVVTDQVNVFVQVENMAWLSSMGKVAKNIANLSLDVVSVNFKQLQNFFHERFS